MYRNPNMPSVTSGGPTGGTSIAALKAGNTGYNSYPQQQYQPQPQPHHHPQQLQQPQQQYQGYQTYDPNRFEGYQQQYDGGFSNNSEDIDYVVDTIKDAIAVKKPTVDNSGSNTASTIESEKEDKKKESKEKKEKKKDFKDDKKPFTFFTVVKEFLLLWVIYMVTSLRPIREFAAKYISALAPNEEGVVSIYGIALYGAIICILYFVFRYVFLNKLI